MFDNNDLLNRFKKAPSALLSTAPEIIYFQIFSDEFGSYLQVVDEKKQAIEIPDHQHYQGPERHLLRMLKGIEERNAFVIDWEKPSDRIYLLQHEELLWQMKHCENLLNEQGESIFFLPDTAQLKLILQNEKKQIHTQLGLWHNYQLHPNPQLLTESFVLLGRSIIEIPPVGEQAEHLHFFQTRIQVDELEAYLSLFFSYTQNIGIQYQQYQVENSEVKAHAQPCLVFERVDEDDALHLRVTQELPGIHFDFFEQYELFRVAELSEMEKKIVVREIAQRPLGELVEHVYEALRKRANSAKERKAIYVEQNRFIIPKEIAAAFIRDVLPALLNEFAFYGAEKLKSYKIKAIQPELQVTLSHGIDFFDGDAYLDFEGEKIPIFDALMQFKKQNYVQLSDGTQAVVNQQYLQKLQRIFQKNKNKVRVSFFDLPIVEELLDKKVKESTFKKSREVFLGFNKIKSSRVRLPNINAKLRPYQKDGYKWLRYLQKHHLGGCLADDMGLGKTIQTISLLSNFYPDEKRPSLIVMPRTLLYNWANEIEKFNPDLSYYIFHGTNRDWQEARKHNLIFTTYGTVRTSVQEMKEQSLFYLVLDESQNIKNPQAQSTKAIMLLDAENRLALSGTPIENNLGELYSLFRFLNPAMFGSLQKFNEHYATPIQKGGNKEIAKELRKKVYPFILRRLKKEVLDDLPEKEEQTLFVEMEAAQKRLYEQRRQFYYETIRTEVKEKGIQQTQFLILQGLSELRQLATVPEAKTEGKIRSPKLEVLKEYLEDIIANDRKALIFVNFLAGIESVSELLDEMEIDAVVMTGATRNRQELVDRFQNEPNCRAFLMTLKTGSLGLNLTAADTIFIYDPWWNISAENQAIDRAYRIGQKNKVISYKIITQGTIEEKMLQLQQKKKELFDSIIASDSAALKSLSEDDLEFMLKG